MSITSPSIHRAVKWFANWMATTMPSISFDDAMQDLWVEALQARLRYDDASEAALLTFVGKHLRWRSYNMLEAESNRLKYETAYSLDSDRTYDPGVQSYKQLLEELNKHLASNASISEFDLKVLRTLVNPPTSLFSDQVDEEDCPANWRLASYLGVGKKQVVNSKNRLRKAIQKVLSK